MKLRCGNRPILLRREGTLLQIEAGAGDRLAVSGGEVRGGIHRQARPAAVADAADGWASDPQTHLRPFRRSFVWSLGGEPVLPVLLRRGVFSNKRWCLTAHR